MDSLRLRRQIFGILYELELFPIFVALLSGGVGAILYNQSPFYGFALFAWMTILILVFLIIFFGIFIIRRQ